MANVDLKSLFTSEKQYTVLQLLNVLIDEVGKSMVKTATINQNVDAGTLTLTVTLSDDSVVTASTDLKSLTDSEKSLISTLTSNVNATSDGVTFLKVVGFEGNETHKGNEIHQGYESHLGDESHSGTASYKGVIKTEEIDNTSGNAMLRNKSTEGAIVLGSSAKKAVIMGSGDRPTYSKDGSDFTGVDLALKSDIEDIQTDKWKELYAELGVGRWANQVFYEKWGDAAIIYDSLAKYYTDCCRIFSDVSFVDGCGTLMDEVTFSTTDFFTTDYIDYGYAFAYFKNPKITLPTMHVANGGLRHMFDNSDLEEIIIADGCEVTTQAGINSCDFMFHNCSKLKHIGKFNFWSVYQGGNWNCFTGCTSLESIEIINIVYSIDIHYSTNFTRDALLVIINNLSTVSVTRTLTIATSCFNLLTESDILIATGKGWQIAAR